MLNNLSIGIIGGTGGIGKWFAAFFAGQGYPVHSVGRSTGTSIPELARSCRVIIISVPIAATIEVIGRVGPHLSEDALLMDLTSLKGGPVEAMVGATVAEVVGCHPLFGPDCPSLAGQNIILCPGRGERWLKRMEEIFVKGGGRVTVTTPEEHDRMMALTQGLTHLDTILMGLTLRDSGVEPSQLDLFSTPVFRTKQAIAAKVFGLRPEMYAAILAGNPETSWIIDLYEKNLSRLKGLIHNGDAAGLAALLKRP